MVWFVESITPLPYHNRLVRLKNSESGMETTMVAGEYTSEANIRRRFPHLAEKQLKQKRGKTK